MGTLLFSASRFPLTTYRLPSTVSCLLCPVCCFLSAVSCLLFPAHCFLSTVSYLLFPVYCFLSTVSYTEQVGVEDSKTMGSDRGRMGNIDARCIQTVHFTAARPRRC